MAKKSNTKQATDTTGFFTSLKYFFTNERTRFISGLVISFVTVYVGLSLISFFFTGGIDQSKIDNVPLGDLVINKVCRHHITKWLIGRGLSCFMDNFKLITKLRYCTRSINDT